MYDTAPHSSPPNPPRHAPSRVRLPHRSNNSPQYWTREGAIHSFQGMTLDASALSLAAASFSLRFTHSFIHILCKESPSSVERIGETQALLRVQAQIHAGRAQILHSPSSIAHLHGPATPDKFEIPIRSESMKNDQYSSPLLKRNSSKSRVQINGSNRERCSMDEERSVRIMDSGVRKPAGSGMKIIDSGCSHGDSFHYKATIEFGILRS
ncbi:hypothetical protein GLYMA_19G066600v4 [Glycine max]|nr:hypothetical protein GLYMA_19G066600v4 [Glycine max]KAH1076696.1 hypothetical protein GYH30_052278 [Glycine max]